MGHRWLCRHVPPSCPQHTPIAPRQLRDSVALLQLGAGRLSLVIPLGVPRRSAGAVPTLRSRLQLTLKLLWKEDRAQHVSQRFMQPRARGRRATGAEPAVWGMDDVADSALQSCLLQATCLGCGLERLHRLAQRLAQLRQLGGPERERSDAANHHQLRQPKPEEPRHTNRSLPPRRRRAVSGQRARVAQERRGRPCAAGRRSSRVGTPGERRAHGLHGVCVCVCYHCLIEVVPLTESRWPDGRRWCGGPCTLLAVLTCRRRHRSAGHEPGLGAPCIRRCALQRQIVLAPVWCVDVS
jgi:hypothetical protein